MMQKKGQTGLILVVVIVVAALVGVFILFSGNNESTGMNGNLVNVPEEASEQPAGGEDTEEKEVIESRTYNIDIIDFAYELKEIRIKQGDSVVWTNRDSTRHTVTSDSESELDSKLLSKGESYSHTFAEKGTYSYHCTPHPYMKAKIIVE